MTPEIADVLADLQQQLAAMLDPMDIPGDWTPRQREAYDLRRSWLDAKIRTIRTQTEILDEVAPSIAALEHWQHLLDHVFRLKLAEELLAMPEQPRTAQEQGRRTNLDLSLQVLFRGKRMLENTSWSLETLELGQLMREHGYDEAPPIENQMRGELPWPGALNVTEQHLTVLRAKRDEAQERLDIVLREAASASASASVSA